MRHTDVPAGFPLQLKTSRPRARRPGSRRQVRTEPAGVFHLVVKVCRVRGSFNDFSLGYCSAVSWVDLARDIWSRAHVLRGDVIVRGEGVEGRMRCIFVSDQSEVESLMIHYGICPV